MSTSEGPQKRRRIAGESKPGERPPVPPAKKVVRRPVARPGAPAQRTAPAPQEVPREESPGAQSTVQDDAAQTAPAAPRIAPRVSRRPERPAGEVAAAPPATSPTSSVGADTAGTGQPGRHVRLTDVALALIALAAVAFGVVFGYRGLADWRSTHGVEGAHAKAAEAAASAAETIFTYRYDRLEQYKKDASDVMTSSFAKDFETISPALQDLAPQRRIQVKATTRDAAPENCGDDCESSRAQVLVFVDQARLADGSSVPTVFGNRVRMTMVERDGRWLVDDIKAL